MFYVHVQAGRATLALGHAHHPGDAPLVFVVSCQMNSVYLLVDGVRVTRREPQHPKRHHDGSVLLGLYTPNVYNASELAERPAPTRLTARNGIRVMAHKPKLGTPHGSSPNSRLYSGDLTDRVESVGRHENLPLGYDRPHMLECSSDGSSRIDDGSPMHLAAQRCGHKE